MTTTATSYQVQYRRVGRKVWCIWATYFTKAEALSVAKDIAEEYAFQTRLAWNEVALRTEKVSVN